MSYSTEEIQTAVEKLVNGSIRRPTDTLGTRRPDVTFSDVQEAAAGAFILYPLSPFYALLLGSKRVVELVRNEASVVGQLKAMVGAVGRRVLPVADVESLFNAKAALQQLEVAVSKQAPKDITKLPAFQRFAANVSDFLVREGSKVKEQGLIVPTPQEARAAIPDLVRQLVDQHETLKSTVASLSNGIADYNAVNLPALVAKGVVSRAREVLGQHADELDAMQPEERLGSIRDVVLDLLAAKSVVQKFGSAGGFTIFVPMTGTGLPYSDASHEAVPAALETQAGPYVVVENVTDQLLVTLDGGTETTVVMNRSLYAQVSGIAKELIVPLGPPPGYIGFIIGDGVNPVVGGGYIPPDNNELKFLFTDLTGFSLTITVTLTVSADLGFAQPVPVQTTCDDINAVLVTNALDTQWKAEPYFLPMHFSGALDCTSTGAATADFTLPVNSGADMSFIVLGDVMTIDAGPNIGTWKIYNILGPTSFSANVIGAGAAVTELGTRVVIGDKQRALRIRAIDPLTMVIKESAVQVVTDNDKNRMGSLNLGLIPYMNGFCRPTTAQMMADDLTQKFPTKLSCKRVTNGIPMSLRTEPGSSTLLVSSKLRTLGSIVFSAGPNVIAVSGVSGLLAAGIVVGDYVVLRGGTPPGTSWLITALTDTTCSASSADTAVSSAGVSLEFGTAPSMNRWEVVEIETGPIQGVYHVAKQGTSVLDIVTIETVPASQDPATRTALLAAGTYGTEHVIINSRARTVASSIAINVASTGLNVLFPGPVTTARGVSPWFQLPQASHAVDTGDQLETHASNYAEPSNVYAITSVSGRLLGIDPPMPSNASWVFDDQPPPFARIRNGVNLNFTEYKALLDAWLLLPANSTTYYRDLNRLLNPLLQNASPTAEQVGSALNHLSLLLNYLLRNDAVDDLDTIEGALLFYKVDTVPAVDTLIKSFVEKGADRAIDLMLQGQFSTFFGMDIHDVSYSGFMQKGIREVVQKDLPVRSTRRLEANQSRLRSSAPSPDFEYTLTDSDDVGVPDIPADFDDTPR